jgi:hypothetical protein
MQGGGDVSFLAFTRVRRDAATASIERVRPGGDSVVVIVVSTGFAFVLGIARESAA